MIFAIFAYVALSLQVMLSNLLVWGDRGVMPSFLMILAVFIGLYAPTLAVAWAMLILGLLADLTQSYMTAGGTLVWLPGPSALGFLMGCFAIMQLRSMMYRDSAVALTAMVFLVGVFIQLTTVAMLTLRAMPGMPSDPIANWSATDELVRRFKELVYTTVMSLPLGLALVRSVRVWGFEPMKNKSHRSW